MISAIKSRTQKGSRTRTWIPSPIEIRRSCDEIRARWTPQERLLRLLTIRDFDGVAADLGLLAVGANRRRS